MNPPGQKRLGFTKKCTVVTDPCEIRVKKIEELIKKNELLFGTHDRLNIMENVVYELADFFQVSRIAAKIRMLDLGYKEAEGVYTYVDDHFISNYS